MAHHYEEEKHLEPINIFIVFLIGLACVLFVLGSIQSFELGAGEMTILIIFTSIVYGVVLFAFLKPKKLRKYLEMPEPQIIEKEVEKIVEKPVIEYREKPVIRYKEVPKEVVKEEPRIRYAIVEAEKKEEKKSKYVGSTYNERYHLRNCRFAGVIKKEYLVEEDDRKYFELRGYEPCKVCNPDKN